MKNFVNFIILLGLIVICFSMGKHIGQHEYQKKLADALYEVEQCESYKKLQGNFYWDDVCKSVCEEEFIKMSC